MSLNDEIKKVCLGLINTLALPHVLYGTVYSQSPLTVKIDNRLYLPESTLVLPLPLNVPPGSPSPVLEVGEKLVLLQERGGKQFVIIGKLGV